MDAPRYMTAKEVCEYFGGISQMTIFRWIKDAKLGFPQPVVINRRRLFAETEIHEFAARHQRTRAAA